MSQIQCYRVNNPNLKGRKGEQKGEQGQCKSLKSKTNTESSALWWALFEALGGSM